MAVFQNGPLTNGIRGKVGDLIFQMVNGIQIVRAMPASIQDHNTPLQQIQRAAFTQAVQEWNQLNVEEREKWNFFAGLRGNRQTHSAARRVDSAPKPLNGTLFDGHGGVVGQKSREADYGRDHGDVEPGEIDLQAPIPYAKTKNLPPAHVAVVLAVGTLDAVWNPWFGEPDIDGLWWYYSEPKARTADSKARAWVQPPYPIHTQRITMDDSEFIDRWGYLLGVDFDGWMWAWKAQVKAATVRIVALEQPGIPAFVQIPYVWKSQLDFLDAQFQDTKGSAVERFYLADDTAPGVWRVWPTPVTLLIGPGEEMLEGEKWRESHLPP